MGQGDGVRALLLFGSNPVVSAPRSERVVERLEALDFLCVADVVMSETAAMADLVLPVAQWAEETGTMTNLEGRVILRQQAQRPPGEVRTDLEVLAAIAERMGFDHGFAVEPELVFAELARASAGGVADYGGIDYERIIEEDGVFWPCPSAQHPGTPRLFTERFGHADGRARFHAVDHSGPAETVDDDFPLHLTTGRTAHQYQSGAQTRRVPELNAEDSAVFVELHPVLAASRGIVPGGAVLVETRRGQIVAAARVTDRIRPDTVFLPFHWAGVNALVNDALDGTSRMPEFKVCAARVAAA